MFRKIRRFKQEMPAEECRELLKTQVRGVLSLLGDEWLPLRPAHRLLVQ